MFWNTTYLIHFGCSQNLKHPLHTYTCKPSLVVVYLDIIMFEQPYNVTPTTIPKVFGTTLKCVSWKCNFVNPQKHIQHIPYLWWYLLHDLWQWNTKVLCKFSYTYSSTYISNQKRFLNSIQSTTTCEVASNPKNKVINLMLFVVVLLIFVIRVWTTALPVIQKLHDALHQQMSIMVAGDVD
jgi:hypothetical protein